MTDDVSNVLSQQTNWKDLFFYQKSEVLYQMTFVFCDRFVPLKGDRTRDQMIQAARSGKQNIVEGLADGVTSSEMMMKLLNVARSSLQELLEDFEDYPKARGLAIWDKSHPRYPGMLEFCRRHNRLAEYQLYFQKWSAEEFCNIAITLCHMVDKMMTSYLQMLVQQFITQGGIKERMHRARTQYRKAQDEELARLRKEVPLLKSEIQRLKDILKEHGIDF